MTDGQTTMQRAAALERLAAEDAVGFLRRRTGRMAELGSENDSLKLDWVEGVARLLADPTGLEAVEAEARALWDQGIRHIIWAGMGGSIITVRVLKEFGFCSANPATGISIYPLDSTDPAALNTIVRQIAEAKGLTLTNGTALSSSQIKTLFQDTMMIGVAMGMTSEEPITHLAWFTQLLEQAGLSPAEHLLVMTLPDSYLDRFAREQHAPSRPLQLDGGNGTGGRMSAPATRVFLLPAALYLIRHTDSPGQLRHVLSQAWQSYDLAQAESQPAQHPFVQLAAALSAASSGGACRLLFDAPDQWDTLVIWIEQLMEESLGKGNKGVVIFRNQDLNSQAPNFSTEGLLRVHLATDMTNEAAQGLPTFTLYQPYLAASAPVERLTAIATSFLGWQLTMALYGYLHDITFSGQPAVENYKTGARKLRELSDPLQALQDWPAVFKDEGLTLYAPAEVSPQENIVSALTSTLRLRHPAYLDFTINGEAPQELKAAVAQRLYPLANDRLGIPLKLRSAPADYHSTEQSEMDGPPALVSLRILLREHEPILAGTYTDTFLRAQAVSTWQALIGQGRACFLLIIDGTPAQASERLTRYLDSL
ncbi:glucose-6-phosphate isomerase [Dictyobacter alpinus]|uniref:Glucose-6-phosphate isomerase n=1 Tax=Dictyobacter alpinus TaxID=2014873 RepID=A0A402BKF1_9CHLR|nr:hypothetical protein [Dictyobacter alpinus]GCE31812.1 glucose-6-phosphate isomerase [Dictyobacter alpinus]